MPFSRSRHNRKSYRPSPHRIFHSGNFYHAPRFSRHYLNTGYHHSGSQRRRFPDRPYNNYGHRSHHTSSRRKGKYSRYHYPQPSGEVFVEEPETESEDEPGSEYDGCDCLDMDDGRVYNLDLESYSDDYDENSYSASEFYYDSDGFPKGEREEIFVISSDFDGVDVNDDLLNDAIDALDAEGAVTNVNDDLIRFYDSDSEESSSDEYDSDLESDILIANSSDSDSATDLDMESDSDSDSEKEHLRKALVKAIESAESESEDDDVFFEIDSNYYNSEDDDDDIVIEDEDFESSDSSDDEGITIYKHRFDLPDRYDSDNNSTDPELEMSDNYLLLCANDSEDEYNVIDLSKDLKGSKDCELVELDDKTYKLNLRLPSLIKEDLKINFLKKENELIISGKFNFICNDDSDSEEEVEEASVEEKNKEAANEDISSDSSSSSESDLESDSDSDSSSSVSSSESEFESESESDKDEEIIEDTQELIKQFQNQEIQFEKSFVFDKVVKFDEISAKFLENGELELIIPNEGVEVDSESNSVPITIEGQTVAQEEIQTEVEAVAEAVAEAATADIEMAT